MKGYQVIQQRFFDGTETPHDVCWSIMPRQKRTNRLRIISYHYSEFGTMRMESDEAVEADDYLQSTAQLHAERNQGLRPLMPRQNLTIDESNVTVDAPPPTLQASYFIISRPFRRLMNRFEQQFYTVFLDIPCAYCGYLSSSRSTCWLTAEEGRREVNAFELTTHLHLDVYRDTKGRVAICRECRKKPRGALDAGPWPPILLNLPKRSRMYLSPLKLNCNLGRTQSHSASNYHNPWSTYRTLTGISSFYSLRLIIEEICTSRATIAHCVCIVESWERSYLLQMPQRPT
jgi:hypothetical protein